MSQLLTYFYKNFQKDFIARFTQVVAECTRLRSDIATFDLRSLLFLVASKNDDQASQALFKEAGFMLGTHLRAISAHIDKNLYEHGKLRVVAVGSVFRSWKYLKPGYYLRSTFTHHLVH